MGRDRCWAGFDSVLSFSAVTLVFSGVVGTTVGETESCPGEISV